MKCHQNVITCMVHHNTLLVHHNTLLPSYISFWWVFICTDRHRCHKKLRG